MVRSKKLIPEVYSGSYDFSIFTGLIDLIYTSREVDILRIKNAHRPKRAFTEDLVHLASLFGLGTTANRELLQMYRMLVKNKGTKPAVKAAVAYVTNVRPTEENVLIYKNRITLYTDGTTSETVSSTDAKAKTIAGYHTVLTAFVDLDEMDSTLFETLVRKIAPANTTLVVRPMSEKFLYFKGKLSINRWDYTVLTTETSE